MKPARVATSARAREMRRGEEEGGNFRALLRFAVGNPKTQ